MVRTFNRRLLNWYRRNGRSLPWRETRDPYRVLVSEFMLQQTQVNRVLVTYGGFLRAFPTLRRLARASRGDVITAWRGLGYNVRAARLHELARAVGDMKNLPTDEKSLRALPGIGPYTARAILVFALGRNVAAIDVNMRRVLSRVFWRMQRTSQARPSADIETRADRLVRHTNAYDWNQAVMDLGATVCLARSPRCGACVMNSLCASAGAMKPPLTRPARREPMLNGVPNRIYRGRIVDRLRHARRPLRLDALGRSIHARFSPRHRSWLERLIVGLEKDGLVRLGGRRSYRSRNVRLA